ncbi:MAG: hypothetical protein Q8Q82_01390 [Hydrogenophaga sp.]|nr:hypothetical protein [Hydrogenophaga sp.]
MNAGPLTSEIPASIPLPLGLMESFSWVVLVQPNTVLELSIPDDYEALSKASAQPEVIAIQRLLTLAHRGAKFRVQWGTVMVERVATSASIYPLLAALLSLESAEHFFPAARPVESIELASIRKVILKNRFTSDMFSDSEAVLCKDSAEARPEDLYLPGTLQLRPREDFETLVVEALAAQSLSGSQAASLYQRAMALGVIVAELFENTDMHGRLDLEGKPLGSDSLRGILFKRIRVELSVLRPKPDEPKTRFVDCFEASVFDTGIGYFSSYTKGTSVFDATLEDEWKVLHNCLERHYYSNIADNRAGHRAMGLYEVLRAIQSLKGRIEIRTGRLYAYRTFLDGELQAQMRPKAEFAHYAWPAPRLLDIGRKYIAKPSEQEPLVGSSVRIVVPLD